VRGTESQAVSALMAMGIDAPAGAWKAADTQLLREAQRDEGVAIFCRGHDGFIPSLLL
jgi:hypothetical protein